MGGFHHGSRDNDDSVLLAGGSYKALSDFLLGSVSNKAATIGTSLITIATIAGVDITAKIGSYASSGHNHDDRYVLRTGDTIPGYISSSFANNQEYGFWIKQAGNSNSMKFTAGNGSHNVGLYCPELGWICYLPNGATAATDAIFSGTAYYATSAGNADTVDGYHASSFALSNHNHDSIYAKLAEHNNLTASGNEFTFASSGFSGGIYINYRTAGGKNGNITEYYLGNGKGGALGTAIHSGNYTTWCATAGHTHTLKIEAASGTPSITLSANTTYKLTAGGSTYLFKTPTDLTGGSGGGDGNTQYYLTLNGTNKGHTSGTNLGSFYAPTSAGTSGQYLKSNGSGAPTWATFNFASSGHSHTLKIETTSDNSSIDLAASTKYKLTAGGSTYVFKTPAAGSASGAYLPLAGGTMTGTIIVSDGNAAGSQNNDIAAIRPIADNWHTIGSSNYHFCEGYINTIYSETVNATSFNGRLYGLATRAQYLTNYSSAYTSPGLGSYSLSYYTTNSSTTSASTNGIANPSNAWYHHILMIHGDSSGYFCDVAWRLDDHTDPSMYFRIRKTSSYTGWVKVLTSENYTDYISSSSGGTSVYQYHNQSMSSNTNYRILTSTRTSNGTLENVYSKSACYMNDNGVYFTSDKKMKKDIRMFSLETNIMDCYNPVRRFSWKSNDMPSIGFISQEVEEWCPEAVGISDDGLKTVNYDVALSALCGAMFNRIKELEQTVKELQYQININKR